MIRTIEIGDMITVGALAEKLSLPATSLIGELFKNGVMATINEKIDFDTAQILVGELGIEVELVAEQKAEESETVTKRTRELSDKAVARPPVVAVMGHVDHGKTSLLDVIRHEHVAAGEAGGITQHISAYQVTHADRIVTFLDTPGHEAFAALREHGAHLTDVAVIVVAADDGIKPQTLEAIRFARKAGVKIVVAITKIDKEGANLDRVRQQLADQDMIPEEWGGETVVVPVSSKTKEGVDKLLDMILLVADVEELKADVAVPGEGLVIESHMEVGRGPIAVALIEQGTLKQGDFVVAGGTYAKVKVLETTNGKQVKSAGPSTPVIIVGFKALPEFGHSFIVVKNEKEARNMASETAHLKGEGSNSLDMTSGELIRLINQKTNQQEFNIIVKADVQGSLTSVVDSLKTLDTAEVAIRIVGAGVGTITENDIRMAATSDAVIYGFHVVMPQNIKQLASRDKVTVRLYKIIYELIDDARSSMSDLLAPEEVITDVGRLIVRGVFKTTKTDAICGGEVTKGKLVIPAYANVFRGDTQLASALPVTNLKHGPTDTKEVLEGEMCGVSLSTSSRVDLQEGDRIEFYTSEIRERTL
jgi:translation initiation factor IF-2